MSVLKSPDPFQLVLNPAGYDALKTDFCTIIQIGFALNCLLGDLLALRRLPDDTAEKLTSSVTGLNQSSVRKIQSVSNLWPFISPETKIFCNSNIFKKFCQCFRLKSGFFRCGREGSSDAGEGVLQMRTSKRFVVKNFRLLENYDVFARTRRMKVESVRTRGEAGRG